MCVCGPIFPPKMAPKTSLFGVRDGPKSNMFWGLLFGCVPARRQLTCPAQPRYRSLYPEVGLLCIGPTKGLVLLYLLTPCLVALITT